MRDVNRGGVINATDLSSVLRSHLQVRIDNYSLAFPLEAIVSVHEAPYVFPAPSAQPGVLGAINVHGEPIVVFDMRRALRLAPGPISTDDRLLLVRCGDRTVGVIVSEVKDLVDVSGQALQQLDPMFGNTPVNRQVIAGLACVPELCAVVEISGLLLPDPWEGKSRDDLFSDRLADEHPLAARTAALAADPATNVQAHTDVAVFHLGGQRYAVPVDAVVEFFQKSAHSPLPFRAAVGASLLNRRGEALPLYDVKPLLGLPSATLPSQVDGIILSGQFCKIAIAVEALVGLLPLPAAAGATARPGRYCLSVHADPDGAIQLLDVAALCAAPQLRVNE